MDSQRWYNGAAVGSQGSSGDRGNGTLMTSREIFIPDVRDMLSRARRTPAHCLYCAKHASSWEHALPEALGGRVQAPILCPAHNNQIAAATDEPMIVQFQPLVHLLDVKRQGGERGVAFRATTDDGERVVVERGGNVRRYKRLDVVRKGSSGKLAYAKGELAKIDELKAAGALEDPGKPVLVTVERPAIVNFQIAVAREAERGVLKIALHFVAGFANDVPMETALELLPHVLGSEPAGGRYVRTVPLDSRFFPKTWPPCHEIRTYPEGIETYVTVLLFGMYGFHVRLPIATSEPLRYLQPLVDAVQPVFEQNDHRRVFTWDDRLTEDDFESVRTQMGFRHGKLMTLAQWRMRTDQCRAAAGRAAKAMFVWRCPFIDAYRAELQQEAFSADEIALCLAFAREVIRTGAAPVWNLPFEYFNP